jgi:hypothetical protein
MLSSTRFAQSKLSGADPYAKQFTSWDLLVTLIFGQMAQTKSLRTLATTSQLPAPIVTTSTQKT